MRLKINLGWLLLLAILLAVLLHPYFQQGVPDTHDGNNHLVRFASYKIALKEGQFPPRWAPNLLNQYGYPVFNFNYPLSNILSLPFSIIKIPYEIIFKGLVFAYLFVGVVSLYKWFKLLDTSAWGIRMAIASWLFFPFLVSTIYFRGNIGEIAAYGLMPVCLYIIEITSRKNLSKFTLGMYGIFFAAYLLSHNITVVFSLPLFFLYALSRIRFQHKKLLEIITVFALGIGLSLWFWLPALIEMNQTNVSNTGLTKEYFLHFPSFTQLVSSPLTFGYSYPGDVDGLSFNLGLMTIMSIFASVLVVVTKKMIDNKVKTDTLLLIFSVVGLLLVFLQTSWSQGIWEMMSFTHVIQFPWRLSIYLGVVTAFLTSRLWEEGIVIRSLLLIAILITIRSVILANPVRFIHIERALYDTQTISTSILAENNPSSFTYDISQAWEPNAEIITGEGHISPVSWTGSARIYKVDVRSTSTVVEPTANFAGWETYVTKNGDKQKVGYVDNSEIDGRIAYILEPGQYEVQTKFTQNTWPRLVGNTVSILSITLIAFLLLRKGKHE